MRKLKFQTKIAFGEETIKTLSEGNELTKLEKEIYIKNFKFSSEIELNSFLKGLDEGIGWNMYNVLQLRKKNKINIPKGELAYSTMHLIRTRYFGMDYNEIGDIIDSIEKSNKKSEIYNKLQTIFLEIDSLNNLVFPEK